MYKSSIYLVIIYFLTYLFIYETYFFTKLVTKVKPNINSVEVHPQLRNTRHPMDGALVGVRSRVGIPFYKTLHKQQRKKKYLG
jgi:hypothetical protein